MTVIDGINRFFALFVDAFKQFGRWRVWLLLAAYFGLVTLILYAHYDFTSPLFSGIITWWTGLVNDQYAAGFTHYPGHFIVMPYFFGIARYVIAFLLEGAVLGIAALWLFRSIAGLGAGDAEARYGRFWRDLGHLVAIWVLLNGLFYLIDVLPMTLFRDELYGYRRRLLALDFVVKPGAMAVVMALLYYSFASVVMYGDNALQALRRSLTTAWHNPLTSLFLAGIMLVVPSVLWGIISRSSTIVDMFTPELVFWLLLLSIVAEMVVYFFWMSTSVLLLLDEE